MKNKLIVFGIILLLIIVGLSGCIEDNIESELNDEEKKFVGIWYTSSDHEYTFMDNGTLSIRKGSEDTSPDIYGFKVDNSIFQRIDHESNTTYEYNYEFSNDILILTYVGSNYSITLNRFSEETLIPLEIVFFELEPNEIFNGQESSLKWYVKNATSYLLTDDAGAEIGSGSHLYCGNFYGDEDVSPIESKSYILKISNFNFEETREIDLTVNEFTSGLTIEDNISDIWQNKLVDDQWIYVPYAEDDKNYLDIIDISHSFDDSVITLTMTFSDTIKFSSKVIYNMYIESQGKTYMAYYSAGVGSWSITSGVKTYDLGWLEHAISGNTFTASFDFENPEFYYEIWGKSLEIGGSGDMSTMDWWGDYAPDSYAPWNS